MSIDSQALFRYYSEVKPVQIGGNSCARGWFVKSNPITTNRIMSLTSRFLCLTSLLLTVAGELAAQTVSSFTPQFGSVGEQVTISGSGFTGTVVVRFNGVQDPSPFVGSSASIQA